MKNTKLLILLISILSLFGCENNNGAGMTSSALAISEQAEVTLTLKDVTPISATVTIYNGSAESISYGSQYKFILEKQIDGIWYVCERATRTADGHHITTTDIERVLESGMADEYQISWDLLYGNLPAGKYRFVKEIETASSLSSTGDYFATEFEIK